MDMAIGQKAVSSATSEQSSSEGRYKHSPKQRGEHTSFCKAAGLKEETSTRNKRPADFSACLFVCIGAAEPRPRFPVCYNRCCPNALIPLPLGHQIKGWATARPFVVHCRPLTSVRITLKILSASGVATPACDANSGHLISLSRTSRTISPAFDNRMLAGTARGWHSTQPCFPVIVMRKANTANPVVVVDEIEKACPSQNGDAQATLLNFLEPETASRYFDECLLTSVNVGEVSWISLANSIEGIKPPLMNRVSLHFVGGPQEEHYPTVIRCLQRDIALELGIDPAILPTRNEEVEALLHTAFMNGASVRRLRAGLFAWIRSEGINRQLH